MSVTNLLQSVCIVHPEPHQFHQRGKRAQDHTVEWKRSRPEPLTIFDLQRVETCAGLDLFLRKKKHEWKHQRIVRHSAKHLGSKWKYKMIKSFAKDKLTWISRLPTPWGTNSSQTFEKCWDTWWNVLIKASSFRWSRVWIKSSIAYSFISDSC